MNTKQNVVIFVKAEFLACVKYRLIALHCTGNEVKSDEEQCC